MTDYTAKYSLPRPEGADQVAVRSDVARLATATDITVAGVEARSDGRLAPLEYYIQSNGGIKGDPGVAGPAGPPAATSDLITKLLSPASPTIPAELGFSIPLRISRHIGGSYSANITAKQFHIPASGKTYYVNGTTGSNANDGLTPETAFATPLYANSRTDIAEMVIAGGTYHRTAGVFLPKRSMTARAAEGEKVTITACDVFTTWTLQSGTTWQVNRSAAGGILDTTDLDVDGHMRPLTKKASIAEVNATPGSWYTASGVVYVNTHDGRQPGTDVWVSMNVNSLAVDPAVTSDISLYFEGIEWVGGTTANLTAPGPFSYLLTKECGFNYSNATNGLSLIGFRRVIHEHTEASNNYLDGFNYHNGTAGETGQVVEINCTGIKNGQIPGSNNGSSSHEGYKAVRVGGNHQENTGANIADVLPSASFNVGVACSASTEYGQDFYGGNMWLDGCYATDSPVSVEAEPGGVVRTKDCVLTGAINGNVITY